MGKPAARIGDMHVCPMVTPGVPPIPHVGGPITGPGCPTVLIGGMPASVMGDMCVCVGPPDTIILGSTGVFIGGKPAARMGDSCAHGGTITLGCPTVLIGEAGGGGGGGIGAMPVNVIVDLMGSMPPAVRNQMAQVVAHKEAAENGDKYVPKVEIKYTVDQNAIKKSAFVNSVFPGKQNYGNCGIQSMAQVIQLITCKKNDEVALLRKSSQKILSGSVRQ